MPRPLGVRLGRGTSSLLPYSSGHSQSQGQRRIEGGELDVTLDVWGCRAVGRGAAKGKPRWRIGPRTVICQHPGLVS